MTTNQNPNANRGTNQSGQPSQQRQDQPHQSGGMKDEPAKSRTAQGNDLSKGKSSY